MNRFFPLLRSTLFFLFGASIAHALIVKPNVAPVVSGPIGDRQHYNDATAVIDLSAYFRDPDASAAVRLVTGTGAAPSGVALVEIYQVE